MLAELPDNAIPVDHKAVPVVEMLIERPGAPKQFAVNRDIGRLPGDLHPVGLARVHAVGAPSHLLRFHIAEGAVDVEAEAAVERIGLIQQVFICRYANLQKEFGGRHLADGVKQPEPVVLHLVAVPFAPGAQKTRLHQMDESPVLLEQGLQLAHMRQHDVVRRLAGAVPISLIGKAHQQLEPQLPGCVEIPLYPVHADFRDHRDGLVVGQIKIDLSQLGGFRRIKRGLLPQHVGGILMLPLLIVLPVAHVAPGFHPEAPIRIFQQGLVSLASDGMKQNGGFHRGHAFLICR